MTALSDKNLYSQEPLKVSVAADAALATGALTTITEAAVAQPSHADRPDAAEKHFLKSMNCSQAILETYASAVGMRPDQAKRLATGFAGGMGRGHECGAVTAAYMVIGLVHGPKEEEVFAEIEEFNRQFKARHCELHCSRLLGVNMGTKEGVKEADEKGVFTSRCPGYVKTAGELLDKMIA